MTPIYLDYAATTPVDPRVAEKMQACLCMDGIFGNPASLHHYGQMAKDAVEEARFAVADLIQAAPEEIIWTSGATESDNLALKGAAHLYQRKGKHIITLKTEHKAVLDTCQQLEKEGFKVSYLAPLPNGLLDLNQLQAALQEDTILVSIMHVNNETGVIQDLASIANITSSRGILFHVDAAQSTGKIPVDVKTIPIDMLSMSAHKIYGPKGIGALYLRKKPRVRVAPLIHGGGHEQGMRSGTLATHQIVGMGAAFTLAKELWTRDYEHITTLRDLFWSGVKTCATISPNTDQSSSVPHIINIRFLGMYAEAVLANLPNIATSTASACIGKGSEGSYVLRAMGLSEDEAKSSARFSFGRFTTRADIEKLTTSLTALWR